jgi:hypothetical protein
MASVRLAADSVWAAEPAAWMVCHEDVPVFHASCCSTTAAVASEASPVRALTRARSFSFGAVSHRPQNGIARSAATAAMADRSLVRPNTVIDDDAVPSSCRQSRLAQQHSLSLRRCTALGDGPSQGRGKRRLARAGQATDRDHCAGYDARGP